MFNHTGGPAAGSVPTLAPFARGVADAALSRFDAVAAQAHIKAIIKALPETFPAADISNWERFFEAYPATVEAIPAERLHPIVLDAIPPTASRAVQSSLSKHKVRIESLTHVQYSNMTCMCVRDRTCTRSLLLTRTPSAAQRLQLSSCAICVRGPRRFPS